MLSPAVPPTVQIRTSVEKHHTPFTQLFSAVKFGQFGFCPRTEPWCSCAILPGLGAGAPKMLQDRYVICFFMKLLGFVACSNSKLSHFRIFSAAIVW